MKKKIINVGIVAHVDAGKTTITERILHQTGAIRALGSVDKGTSQTDSLEIEKERGISVRLSSASVESDGIQINLIDTPGHIDFSSEVSRSLLALDCAILVISAVEGVQAHTENIFEGIKKLKIPTLIFINKIDRIGANSENVISQIKQELSENFIPLQEIKNEGSDEATVVEKLFVENIDETLLENITSLDENLIEKYLNDEKLNREEIYSSFKSAIKNFEVIPLLFGSAKFGIGIETLLNAIKIMMPEASQKSDEDPTGVVYKVEHDKQLGKIASIRLFTGSVKNREVIKINGQDEKINQIKKMFSSKLEDTGIVSAGDTAVIRGVENVRPGQLIGNIPNKKITNITEPFLTVKAEPEENLDYSELVSAMHQLADEDPALDLLWLKDERELHIKVMGQIHIEILESLLHKRFNLKVKFGKPIVIYKESPKEITDVTERYTMPKPCWAVVKFLIEPLKRGEGISFESKVGVNQIAHRYQQEVKRTIEESLKQGPMGWEVTDLKITLMDGEDHNVHSRAGDFVIATPMAILKGLNQIGTKLLEPMLKFNISGPEEFCGKILSGLTILRAEFGNPEIVDGNFKINGIIPVATSLDYPIKLGSLTSGKGKFSTKFFGYRECPVELGETIPYRGISPLDRSKYILKARGAMT